MAVIAARRAHPAGRAAIGAACALAIAAAGHLPAWAQPAPASSDSDALFQEGKALIDQGRFPEACEKLQRSLDLARRGGTLLNLAECRAKEGRTATALALFQDALDQAVKDGRDDRVEFAQRRIEAVRAELSWLTVTTAAGADLPGLTITRDGEVVPRTSWGAALPLDPGAHTVVATASGRERFEATVTLAGGGDKQSLEIPVLPPARAEAPPAALPAPARAKPGPGAARPPDAVGGAWRKPAGITALGVGVAALGIGAVFGVKAIGDSAESQRLCPGDTCLTEEGLTRNEDARTAATIANVLVPVGLVATGAGLYLILSSRAPDASPSSALPLRLAIVPSAGPGGAGGWLRGAW